MSETYRWRRPKRPTEEILYGLNWRPWLTLRGVTMTDATWIVPDGLSDLGHSHAEGIAMVMLGGGQPGEYTLTCRATLSNGEKPEQLVVLTVPKP